MRMSAALMLALGLAVATLPGVVLAQVLLEPTPEAIQSFNRSTGHKIALMHVTC